MTDDKNNLGNSIVFATAFAAARASRLKKQEMDLKKQEMEIMNKRGAADELKKFADLLKEGVISQTEFDTQKKRLLGEEKVAVVKKGWFG